MSGFHALPGAGFFDKLVTRAEAIDSLLCVGLDPHVSELGDDQSAASAKAYCARIIAATCDVAVAYKPNAAFFEAFGADGVAALKEVIGMVPQEIPVLLDVKRGDIGSTAAAYATASFDELGAHAVTINAYLGKDTVRPFLTNPARGVFILCKTSNPSSDEVQSLRLEGKGRAVFEEMAALANSWNVDNNVGLVVGATDVDALRRARAAAPKLWILAPGVGAQGGDLDKACEAGLDPQGMGLLIPVSRGISRSEDPGAAAAELKEKINASREKCKLRAAKAGAGGGAGGGAGAGAHDLEKYQEDFIKFALSQNVLRFGSFKLKSGRQSPYFFNAGLFSTGGALARLGRFYSSAVMKANPPLEFDVVFGPAYKGISLGAAVALTLSDRHGLDVGFAYNRKEVKDHGEGGVLVGAQLEGKRVLIVDDVITAGTAIREVMGILKGVGAVAAGVVIALDRQETTGPKEEGGTSAVQQVQESFGIRVLSVVDLSHITAFLSSASSASIPGEGGIGGVPGGYTQALEDLKAYREKYGVDC